MVALVTRAALNGKQSLDNVANNLLLSQGPLTGLSQDRSSTPTTQRLISCSSRDCQCCLRLHNLPPLHSLHCRTHKPNFPQSPWLCRRVLRNLHPRRRPRYLVSNPQHPCQPSHRLGQSDHRDTITPPAEIQLLWILERNLPSFYTGQRVHQYARRRKFARLYRPVFILCQFAEQQDLHGGFWHCRHRCYSNTGHCLSVERPERERAICID